MPDRPILDSPADLKKRLEAERAGMPFVHYRDGEAEQRILLLDPGQEHVTVGREEGCEVCLGWDSGVSRLHARFERSGDTWTIYDGGLSRNGTYLNGERVQGHRVLRDGDRLRLGTTEMCFRDPKPQRSRTVILGDELAVPTLSPAQYRVLVALCRPYKHGSSFARPAANKEIATELVLSVEAVKTHLRALFSKFGLDELPQNEKRLRLAEQAFVHGLVRESEL